MRNHPQQPTCGKILLLEYNEISPTLLLNWFEQSKLPNFKRLYDESVVFVSEADEIDPVNWEPWIQWYSIHTGLPFKEHRVFHLTDGPRAGHIDLWQLAQQAGKIVMNCSSMNAKGFTGERSFFLPDPWCTSEACCPPEINIYAQVVTAAVQEYSNERLPLRSGDYATFLRFLIGHGLSLRTASAIVKHLVSEKLFSKDLHWKRVSLLDRLQFDLFSYYYTRFKPDFATFFSNSTAHLQHAYWRHMDPAPFKIKPSANEQDAYGDAVLFGYEEMDRMLGRFLNLIDQDTVLILSSALSQQPFLKWEDKGGQRFYRLHDATAFLSLLGTSPVEVKPIMTHQYVVHFGSEEARRLASIRLRSVSLEGTSIFGVEDGPDDSLEFGCQIFTPVTANPPLTGIQDVNRVINFDDVLYQIAGVKSGCHHPDGVLWIRLGRQLHKVHSQHVSILDLAPTICDLLGVDACRLRGAPFPGSSLAGQLGFDLGDVSSGRNGRFSHRTPNAAQLR